MALSAAITWEVRTTAADTNGGGFVTGASGTDFSQQDAAQYSFTDLSVDPVSNTKVQSISHSFIAADVGNLINISAGTGWTVGVYQVVSVSGGEATLDRSPAAIGITGGTWALGGALATPGKVAGLLVAGNDVWQKSGTYTITTTTANVSGGVINLTVGGVDDANALRWIGYGTTRGDYAGQPLIQVASSGVTGVTLFTIAAQRTYSDNLAFDGRSKSGIRGMGTNLQYVTTVARIWAKNCTNIGLSFNDSATLLFCRASGCSVLSAGIAIGTRCLAYGCIADSNTIWGIEAVGVSAAVVNCLAYNNTQDGIYFNSLQGFCAGNTAYGNGGHGFTLAGTVLYNTSVINCLAANNGGYGFQAASVVDVANLFNCAGYSNTSGNVSANLTHIPGFVILSAAPFVNAAAGNFALNPTPGGGAACRAAGVPGAFPGGLTTGYLDIGAVQHQDSGGAKRRAWG